MDFPSLILADTANPSPLDNLNDVVLKTGFDWPHVAAQSICFLLVATVLYLYAFGPILKILDQRRRLIEEGLASAEKAKRELRETEEARKAILQKATAQADQMIAEATQAALAQKAMILERAQVEATDIVTKARVQAVTESEHTRTELMKEVGNLVLSTTQLVTGKVLTPSDQQRLTEEARLHITASGN
jgi:F-type H+-transporting ATPase subunit b